MEYEPVTRTNGHAEIGGKENDASSVNDNLTPPGHRRSLSGSILSRLSFLRNNSEETQDPSKKGPPSPEYDVGDDKEKMSHKKTSRAMAVAVQQQKTRRRKGSLRKAALLGRGAQRERREMKTQPVDTENDAGYTADGAISPTSPDESSQMNRFGLGISDLTPRPSIDSFSDISPRSGISTIKTLPMGIEDPLITSPNLTTSPTLTYTSTTDEEDVLSIPSHTLPPPRLDPSSGSDSYFTGQPPINRRRSAKRAKSPLSTMPVKPLTVPDEDWDYAETEKWGWVILIVTWIVFVIGMGSCFGVWSWAWDVGETPYAPPEFHDDPTLPIVGYYPALIILTSVMAWVWVVVAWVGMKYFRHAKISSD